MRKILFFALLLVAPLLRAATGDYTVTIESNGWVADLLITGFATGSTYNFNLVTNGNQSNVPTTSGASFTPYLTVVSDGYDDAGNTTTITRTVYLTKVLRFVYSTSTIPVSGSITGTLNDGDTLTQGTSAATAIVTGKQTGGTMVYVYNVAGSPDNSHVWTGTSGSFTPTATPTLLTQPTNYEEVGATAMFVRVALSDYIYQEDSVAGGTYPSGTAPTFTAPAGFIVSGANNSTVYSAAAITNNSTAPYPKVVGNWSWPGLGRITGSTFPLRAVAFHSSAQNGRPVRCVKFTAADTHSHTATDIELIPRYDSTVGDAVPVIEYIGNVSSSSLTALDTITCNFLAYPWMGDPTSVLNTGDGSNSQPTPLYAPITMLNDKSNTYGITWALVDTGGSDGGANTVYDNASTPWNNSTNQAAAYKFLTIGKALAACSTYNASHNSNHNDPGGVVVVCNAGSYAWLGSSNTYGGGNPVIPFTVTSSIAAGQYGATISSQSGNTNARNMAIVNNMAITATTGGGCFTGFSYVWLDQCNINSASGVPFYQNTIWWVTRSAVTNLGGMGLRAFSTVNAPCSLIRGNTITTVGSLALQTYCVLGNLKTGNSTGAFTTIRQISSSACPRCDNQVVAYNRWYGLNVNIGDLFSWYNDMTMTQGAALVQNVFENWKESTTDLSLIVGDSQTSAINPTYNLIFWHNTPVGQRLNMAYNTNAGNSYTCQYWSLKNNFSWATYYKTDTFPTANGLRVGDWSSGFGVNYSGNLTGSEAGNFQQDFYGFGTAWSNWGNSPGTFSPYAKFVACAAYDYPSASGTTHDAAGGGNYHLVPGSPGENLQLSWVMPYDLDGLPRSAVDAAGAYRQLPKGHGLLW